MATICVTGRLGRDSELRTTQGGDKVLSFSIADDGGYGEKRRTQWIDCALWGKRAESLAQYLSKGSLVEISGSPSVRTYESKGEHKAVIQVNVQEVKLHGGGQKADKPVADRGRATRGDDLDDGSDIPF